MDNTLDNKNGLAFGYPEQPNKSHKSVSNRLLKGEFIHIGDTEYEYLQRNQIWYRQFLEETFEIELMFSKECFYCVSLEKASGYTKKILTVVAILMYELDKAGANAVSEIRDGEFSLERINTLIMNSVQFSRYAAKIEPRFISKLVEFGLAQNTEDNKFVFTPAIDIFIDEYDNLREQVTALEETSK